MRRNGGGVVVVVVPYTLIICRLEVKFDAIVPEIVAGCYDPSDHLCSRVQVQLAQLASFSRGDQIEASKL